MLTERNGGRDKRVSCLALVNLLNYFTSAGTCHVVKTESLHFCPSHQKKNYCIASVPQRVCYCRPALTSWINKCLQKENQDKSPTLCLQ